MKDVKSGKLKSVYALVSEETFLRDEAANALREAALKGGVAGFNEDLFHGKEVTGMTIANAAQTLPMMAPMRLVFVRDIDQISEPDALVAYVLDPNPQTCLVMTANKLNGSTKLAKALKKTGARYDEKAVKAGDMRDFIRRQADERGHPISPGAVHALSEALGQDLSATVDAVERLGFFVGPGQQIDEAAVTACVSRLRVDTIWALVDAVGLKDRKRALSAAGSLLRDREPPLRILAMIARQLRIVSRMRHALAQGQSDRDAAKYAGAPPFKARELKEAARRFRLGQLRHAFSILDEADRLLKGSKVPGDVVLEHTIIQLAS